MLYQAVAVLSGNSKVTGVVTFEQPSIFGHVTISGYLKGLDPNSKRGFHIQYAPQYCINSLRISLTVRAYSQYGNITDGCISTGSHYNPFGRKHGAPSDHERHVGDLGNIESNNQGIAPFEFTDALISLNGPLSIVG